MLGFSSSEMLLAASQGVLIFFVRFLIRWYHHKADRGWILFSQQNGREVTIDAISWWLLSPNGPCVQEHLLLHGIFAFLGKGSLKQKRWEGSNSLAVSEDTGYTSSPIYMLEAASRAPYIYIKSMETMLFAIQFLDLEGWIWVMFANLCFAP